MTSSPVVLGLRRSFGFGDRLGSATPGHLAAVAGRSFTPIFAQQSIREMQRTGRTPAQVMETAQEALGSFEGVWGADADHLQTPADVEAVAAAGFCFFTIDPSAHVVAAETLRPEELAAQTEQMIERGVAGRNEFEDLYLDKPHAIGDGLELQFDRDTLQRASVKYGAALHHAEKMAKVIADRQSGRPFELELSIDETDTATTPLEHLFVGLELRRRGVEVISVAPRFVGDFEKGIDYRGDLAEFESHYRAHVAIAQACGPYKLSIHSGSDKFSVYPIMGRLSGEHLHVKTAGTSYLEAVRTVCRVDRPLFREIVALARERFSADCATYQISSTLNDAPATPADDDLEAVYLETDAGRQILHVTYGSVLQHELRERLLATLDRYADLHHELVAAHMSRHLDALEA